MFIGSITRTVSWTMVARRRRRHRTAVAAPVCTSATCRAWSTTEVQGGTRRPDAAHAWTPEVHASVPVSVSCVFLLFWDRQVLLCFCFWVFLFVRENCCACVRFWYVPPVSVCFVFGDTLGLGARQSPGGGAAGVAARSGGAVRAIS
jgi:hypothetical protein